VVDLSIGTPVDPTPQVVQEALRAAANAPGYPYTAGTVQVRAACAAWLARCFGVTGLDPAWVLPTIGSKELVALLPQLLGAAPGSRVLHPVLSYPTYDVGARLAGCVPEPLDEPPASARDVAMVWLNSPSNPTGQVLSADQLRGWVRWGREHGVPIVSDECYLELGWSAQPVSVLHPSVCGPSLDGVLAVHSLSKRSNLAGYRAGFLGGDPELVAALLEVRKHAGLIVPAPVQAAMVAAYGDDEHVRSQRARYAAHREVLLAAFVASGFTISGSQAVLYLWVSRGEPCWDTVDALARIGVLVAPGEFYGAAGSRHVRVALTATDDRVAAAAERLHAQA